MTSLTDYFRQFRGLCRCSLQIHGTREDCQATCRETHWESTCWKAMARSRPTTMRTSRWHLYIYPLMVRSPLVSSPFDASTPWSKSSSLSCTPFTMEFVPLKGILVFLERMASGGWTDRTTPVSNFIRAAWLSFSGLIHVLGTAPIKAPFYHAYIIPVLIRSVFWCWNYFWGVPILETLWYLKNEEITAGNGENPQFYRQWTVEDSQNWLCTKSSQRQRILSAWIPGDLENTGFPATLMSSDKIPQALKMKKW